MKIDAHVHILSPDFIRRMDKNIDRDEHFRLLHSGPQARFATAKDVLADMEKTGMDKSVVFGFSSHDMGMCREANDYVIDAVKRFPGRFIGFAIVPPFDPAAERELIRCCEAGLKGAGEIIPQAVKVDIEDQEQMERFTATCRELHFPMLIHTNEQVGHFYPGKGKTGPVQAYQLALHNPDNIIVFAHWGGGLFFYELMPELGPVLKNVYYDTAASPFLYAPAVLEAARTAGVLKKVLFGSDFPLLSPARYEKQWAQVDLTAGERADIWGENACRLF